MQQEMKGVNTGLTQLLVYLMCDIIGRATETQPRMIEVMFLHHYQYTVSMI